MNHFNNCHCTEHHKPNPLFADDGFGCLVEIPITLFWRSYDFVFNHGAGEHVSASYVSITGHI